MTENNKYYYAFLVYDSSSKDYIFGLNPGVKVSALGNEKNLIIKKIQSLKEASLFFKTTLGTW
jgi:hypothetical protein